MWMWDRLSNNCKKQNFNKKDVNNYKEYKCGFGIVEIFMLYSIMIAMTLVFLPMLVSVI